MGSSVAEQILCRHSDVASDLSQQDGGNIPAGVVGNGGTTSIDVPVLHVRASLPYQDES
jgi:hypothetical protein